MEMRSADSGVSGTAVAGMSEELDAGRDAYRRRAWSDAYRQLSGADQTSALGVADLELLATAAYLTGRESEFQSCLERAHHAHQENADRAAAARCAFWLGLTLFL